MAASPAPPAVSIPDLKRLLQEKEARLAELVRKREQLRQQLIRLDRQLQAAASPGRRPRPRRPRWANPLPLRSVVLELLKQHKDGLRMGELTQKVLETGYKSTSKKFDVVLYQCLYHAPEIERDVDSRRYRLKK